MAQKPKVSFVMPVFQQEEFVEEAIESVLDQSYSDIELIVVDDGSRDGSAKKIGKYKNNHIVFIEQKNLGPSAALNIALQRCAGDFVAFMGGDDISFRHRAEEQIEILLASNADIVASEPQLIDDIGRPLIEDADPVFFNIDINSFRKRPLSRLFYDGNCICAPSVMMRRALTTSVGTFSPALVQLQDYDYWLRAIMLGAKIELTKDPIVKYRKRTGGKNLSSRKFSDRILIEAGAVFRKVYSNITQEMIVDQFIGSIYPRVSMDVYDLEALRVVAFLRHTSRNVREIGYQKAIEYFETYPNGGELAKRFGFTPLDVSSLIVNDSGVLPLYAR